MKFLGWVLVEAALVALAVNMGREQGDEWGAFFGILAAGWAVHLFICGARAEMARGAPSHADYYP